MFAAIKEYARGLMHLLYPRLCEGCSKPLIPAEQVLCMSCEQHLSVTGYHHIPDNATAARLAGRFPFMHATSFAYFVNDGLLQHLLHGLKYKGKRETGIYLGKLLGEELQNAAWAKCIDIIVPVPLHPKKEAARGYNQSALIAQGMSETLRIPCLPHGLLRERHTESQTKKTRAERLANMQDAFRIADINMLAGKHVLLSDDVLTTGATLEACAMALLKAPGIKISIATAGIAL